MLIEKTARWGRHGFRDVDERQFDRGERNLPWGYESGPEDFSTADADRVRDELWGDIIPKRLSRAADFEKIRRSGGKAGNFHFSEKEKPSKHFRSGSMVSGRNIRNFKLK